jgi:isoprenylcysteine carboxyl methyltransferase (ICMT) family protein YpbQ
MGAWREKRAPFLQMKIMPASLLSFLAFAITLRVSSLVISLRNEARLRAFGARQYGATNSTVLTLLHITFYVAAIVEGAHKHLSLSALTWLGMAIYALSMLALFVVIRSLGRVWTMKIYVAPDTC